MRALILNASPWRNGNISSMLEAMREEAEEHGWEVVCETVDDLAVHPCVGCMQCRSAHECCLGEDDAHRIARSLAGYDLYIIGAPCYWGNMPGTLKLLFDRMVYAMVDTEHGGLLPRKLLKGKKAIIITASTTPSPWNRWFGQTGGVVKALKSIFKISGIKLVGDYQKGGTRKSVAVTPRDIRKVVELLPK